MKKKVLAALELAEEQLQEIWKLQETETSSAKLTDLDKNEIEVKAKLSILRHLLQK